MYIPRIWLLDVPTIEFPVPYIALCTADPSASGLKALKTKLPKDWFDRLKTPPQNTQTQCTSLYTSGIFENMLADLAGRQLFLFKWDKEKNEHRNIFLPCGSDVFPGAGESPKTDTGEAWDPVESCSELLLFNVSQTIPQWWAPTSCKQCFFSIDTSNHEDVPVSFLVTRWNDTELADVSRISHLNCPSPSAIKHGNGTHPPFDTCPTKTYINYHPSATFDYRWGKYLQVWWYVFPPRWSLHSLYTHLSQAVVGKKHTHMIPYAPWCSNIYQTWGWSIWTCWKKYSSTMEHIG